MPAVAVQDANIDKHARHDTYLHDREAKILENIDQRIQKGRFELPHLPSTSMMVIEMSSKPTVEIGKLVESIATDPVLSSELLKTANSVVYAGAEPVDSLQMAVMRIGLRTLRSLLFTLSVRGAIMHEKVIAHFAEEVWRQSYSMGSIARAIAPFARMDPERAFLIGLLHDIGKVPLLAMLGREIKKEGELTRALVGKVFYLHHEAVGAAVAKAWNLREEIVSAAGCHHHFEQNTEHTKAAALARLVHQLDLQLSLESEQELRALIHSPELDALEIHPDNRWQVIEAATKAFVPVMSGVAAPV
jgi:putative nucleotidyltransferase with HDIG domain